MKRPACMSDDDWERWQTLNAVSAISNQADTPCRDCTMAFYAEMLVTDRCDGYPVVNGALRKATVDRRWELRRERWRTYKATSRGRL
jgi:hypothetical protein